MKITSGIVKGMIALLLAFMPALAAMRMRGGQATAYVCRDFACDAPTTDPGELNGILVKSMHRD